MSKVTFSNGTKVRVIGAEHIGTVRATVFKGETQFVIIDYPDLPYLVTRPVGDVKLATEPLKVGDRVWNEDWNEGGVILFLHESRSIAMALVQADDGDTIQHRVDSLKRVN